MSPHAVRLLWALLVALLSTSAVRAAPPAKESDQPARTDSAGDPLPPGAVARMGTSRLRPAYRVNALTFSPDGTLLASAGQDKVVSLWDVHDGRERQHLTDMPVVPDDVQFSEDGRSVRVTVGNSVRVWDVATGKEQQRLGGQMDMGQPAALSADGKLLATGSGKFNDASLRLWETPNNRLVHQLEGHRQVVRSLAFAPDGKVLASGGMDGTVFLWDTAEGKELQRLTGHKGGVRLLLFAPDGKNVVSVGDDGTVRFWDVATGKNTWTYQQHLGYGHTLAFAADGQTLAVGETGGWVVFLETATGKVATKWRADRMMVVALAWSPDGKQLATIGMTGPIHLWDPAGKELSQSEGHQEEVVRLACTPDGKALFTSSSDGTVRRWDTATGKEEWRLDGVDPGGEPGRLVSFAPDGQTFVTRKQDRVLRVFDAGTGKELRPLVKKQTPGEQITGIAFSPDSKLLAVASPEALRLYDPSTGTEVRMQRERRFHTVRMVFTPDSRYLLNETFTGGGLVESEVATGRTVRSFRVGGVDSAPVFSPDGRTLATCGGVLIQLLEEATGQERAQLGGPNGSPRVLAFSPDGRLLVSGNADRSLTFWNLATGKEVHRIEHPGVPTSLVWLPGGEAVASGSSDGTVLVWGVKEVFADLRPPSVGLTARELDGLWADLLGKDARRDPGGTEARKAYDAIRTLSAGGKAAVAMLEERLPSLGTTEADRVTRVRVVEVLEHSGTPEARRLLEKLAGENGPPAEEAKAAVERLNR